MSEDQPPGIEEGDIDTIPDSTSAAQRVGEFLEEFGDGLVIGQSRPDEVWGYPPLYARDLQALINAVTKGTEFRQEIVKQRDEARIDLATLKSSRDFWWDSVGRERRELTEQRDQARDIAVHLEQELAEVSRQLAESKGRVRIHLDERDEAWQKLARVREFCGERAQYIISINNCPPDNYASYYRWQGGAEARRQLSERLGLPVAWPAEYKDRKVAR